MFSSPVEIVNAYLDPVHTRANSKVLVIYYVDVNMIKGYGMMDVKICKIDERYLKPGFWWRMVEWIAYQPHTCIESHAEPIPYKSRHESADRPSACVVIGGLQTDNMIIQDYIIWDEEIVGEAPKFLKMTTDALKEAQLEQASPPYCRLEGLAEPIFTFSRFLKPLERIPGRLRGRLRRADIRCRQRGLGSGGNMGNMPSRRRRRIRLLLPRQSPSRRRRLLQSGR